ncbi:MAG: hypothetical protein H0W36_10110 [Gemmatimonadetes bacterium]|nr:hypothetical protein [Gemmatimonadota bacterium]
MSPSRPPDPGARRVACPHCGSTDVAVESEFGSSLMTRQFYCRGCRTVFEWIKWEAEDYPGRWLDAEEGKGPE